MRVTLIALLMLVSSTAEARAKKHARKARHVALEAVEPPVLTPAAEVSAVERPPATAVVHMQAPPPAPPADTMLGLNLAAGPDTALSLGGPLRWSAGAFTRAEWRFASALRIFGVGVEGGLARVWLDSGGVRGGGYLGYVAPVVTANREYGRHTLSVRTGPAVSYARIDGATSAAATHDVGVSFGFLAGLSYAYVNRWGGIWAGVHYRMSPYFAANQLYTGHMLGVQIGYTFAI